MSAHFFRRAGSVCGKFAFCPKLVFGRLTVFFRSSVASSVAIKRSSIKSEIVTGFGVRRYRRSRHSVKTETSSVSLWWSFLAVFFTTETRSSHGDTEKSYPKQKTRTTFQRRWFGLRCLPMFVVSADKHLLVSVTAINGRGRLRNQDLQSPTHTREYRRQLSCRLDHFALN